MFDKSLQSHVVPVCVQFQRMWGVGKQSTFYMRLIIFKGRSGLIFD